MRKQKLKISIAKLEDTKGIMKFMNDVWKKDHILSRNKELFLHEFQNKENLNMIIAKDSTNTIVGIFGFMYYNSCDIPDVAGSLWKIDEKVKEPLLGFKLREYFKKNIQHNFFAAPGANLTTKPIYKYLKINWNQMEHYYFANSNLKKFLIAKNPLVKQIPTLKSNAIIKHVDDINEIKDFNFLENKKIVPRKDLKYVKNKFFNHPIHKYDIYTLTSNNLIKNIFICRTLFASASSVYRIVDFYGDLEYMHEIVQFLKLYIMEHNHEYFDFVSFGLNEELLLQAGLNKLDFDDGETIIPNLFEPFVQKNSPIYCVSDKTDLELRQFKADGDQDRPNL